MGKGGYNGGSTLYRCEIPKSKPKKSKTDIPSDYDFEKQCSNINKALEIRKENINKPEKNLAPTPQDKHKRRKSVKKKAVEKRN